MASDAMTRAKTLLVNGIPPLKRHADEKHRLLSGQKAALSRIARLESEVKALSLSAATARRDDLEYLFVVTYGRSGSTLLQGVLNSIDGFCIRGENLGALHSLHEYHSAGMRLRALRDVRDYSSPRSPWFGADGYSESLAIDRLRTAAIDTILKPSEGTRVAGFKEVKWWYEDWEAYFDFLDKLFPGFRVVVNTRNLDNVSQSKWWGEDEHSRELLASYEQRLDDIARRMGERAYRVCYDEWTADPRVLRGMYRWLGEDFDLETVESVLQVRHSY